MDPVTPQSGPGQSTTGNAQDPVQDFKAQLEAERQARQAAEKRYNEIRTFADRKIGDLTNQLRSRPETVTQDWTSSPWADEAPQEKPRKPNGQFRQERDEQSAWSSAQDGFALDMIRSGAQGWQDDYNAAIQYVQDAQKAAEVATFDQNGLLDYRRSLNNAVRAIRLERFSQGQAQNQNANPQARAQAVISGSGASGAEEPVNLDNMTAEQMLKSGMLDQFMDPKDPIRR